MEERRTKTRQLTCIPAFFESKRESQDLALIRDISISGARLFTRVKLEPEEAVTLHLYLGAEGSAPKKSEGKVVRVERRDPAQADVWAFEVGVVFAEPITSYEAEIEDLCKRQEAAGILKR